MFFSLTALGPASLGLPPARAATAWSVATAWPPCTRGLPAEPGRGGREGGRLGGQRRRLALPSFVATSSACRPSARPGPAPGRLCRLLPAERPPRAHPGCPHLLGPASRPRVLLAPGAPGHVLGTAAARPTLLPALGGEPGTAPSCLGARPGLGNFPARVCVGRGAGCSGARGGRGPDARRPPPPRPGPAVGASPCLLSPESHKGTDNTGGLVKTAMCRSRQTNKSPYLFI